MKNGKYKNQAGTSWYKDYLLHREDGPALILINGSKEWRIKGELHREDGPAMTFPDGRQIWFFQGKRHREDGPAMEYGDGSKAWWINDKEFTEDEFHRFLEKKVLNEKLQSTFKERQKDKKKKI